MQCDESPNSCNACIKRRTRCSFQPTTPPPPSPNLDRTVPFQVSSLLDLELLHNFTTKTCLSASTNMDLVRFYQTDFITEALKSNHLLHCFLGVSALHLAQQYQEIFEEADEQQKPIIRSKIDRYSIAAHFHHNAGLSSFRQTLTNITSENCHALFGCAILIFITSFTECCQDLRSVPDSTLSTYGNQESSPNIMKWLLLLRGIKTVVDEGREWLHAGPMAPIISIARAKGYESNSGKIREDLTAYFNQLSGAFVQYSEPRVSDICIAAVELLRKSFAGMASGCDHSIVFYWPTLVHSDFVTLLELKTPEALVVLSSYCVLLHTQNSRWWIKGWPENMLKVLERTVENQWREWLWWPLQAIKNPGTGRHIYNVPNANVLL